MRYLQTVFLFYIPHQLLYIWDIFKQFSCTIFLINCSTYAIFTNSLLILYSSSIALPIRYLQTVFLFYILHQLLYLLDIHKQLSGSIFPINWSTYEIFTNSLLVLCSSSIGLPMRYLQIVFSFTICHLSTYEIFTVFSFLNNWSTYETFTNILLFQF